MPRSSGSLGVYAYDAVTVIATTYAKVGKVDNDASVKWLHSLTSPIALHGATGPLYWQPNGTMREFFFSTYRVHNGSFEFAKDLVMR
jgi:hypothetical protein